MPMTNFTCVDGADCGSKYAGFCNTTAGACYCSSYFSTFFNTTDGGCSQPETAPGGSLYGGVVGWKVFGSLVYVPLFFWLCYVLFRIRAHKMNTALKNRVMMMSIASVGCRWLKVVCFFEGALFTNVVGIVFDIISAYLAILSVLFVLLVWLNILYTGPMTKFLIRFRNGIVAGFSFTFTWALVFLGVQIATPFAGFKPLIITIYGATLLIYVLVFVSLLVYNGVKLYKRLNKFKNNASSEQFARRITKWVYALLFATSLAVIEQIIDNFIPKNLVIILIAQYIDVVVFGSVYASTGGFFSVQTVEVSRESFVSDMDTEMEESEPPTRDASLATGKDEAATLV